MVLTLSVFVATTSLVLLIGLVISGRKSPVEARLEGLAPERPPAFQIGDDALYAEVPKFSPFRMLMPANETGRRQLGERLVQAGLYKKNAYVIYVTTKGLLTLVPFAAGIVAGAAGLVAPATGLLAGAGAAVFGMNLMSFWLDSRLKQRQTAMRRALPDALDVIIICLEGSLSLQASFSRVSSDLRSVHPTLAAEMAIVQREIQMGRSTGGALRNFAQRFDLEELRSMASVVLQAERFGSSVARALRIHADSLRERRLFQAEELAQKASVKILFPTLAFIFPTLFIVILGPAAFDLFEALGGLNRQ
jgi:tight adherence protein C